MTESLISCRTVPDNGIRAGSGFSPIRGRSESSMGSKLQPLFSTTEHNLLRLRAMNERAEQLQASYARDHEEMVSMILDLYPRFGLEPPSRAKRFPLDRINAPLPTSNTRNQISSFSQSQIAIPNQSYRPSSISHSSPSPTDYISIQSSTTVVSPPSPSTLVENAKIYIPQFQSSPPEVGIEQRIVVADFTPMDHTLVEEKKAKAADKKAAAAKASAAAIEDRVTDTLRAHKVFDEIPQTIPLVIRKLLDKTPPSLSQVLDADDDAITTTTSSLAVAPYFDTVPTPAPSAVTTTTTTSYGSMAKLCTQTSCNVFDEMSETHHTANLSNDTPLRPTKSNKTPKYNDPSSKHGTRRQDYAEFYGSTEGSPVSSKGQEEWSHHRFSDKSREVYGAVVSEPKPVEMKPAEYCARRLICPNFYTPTELQATSTQLGVVRVDHFTFPSLIKCYPHHHVYVTGHNLHCNRCNTFLQDSLTFMYFASMHATLARRVFDEKVVRGIVLVNLMFTARVPDALIITEHPIIKVGVVFCGRRSPGGQASYLMCSYNWNNGMLTCTQHNLLQKAIDEWGFKWKVNVRMGDTRALNNGTGSAQANFTNDMKRDYIMQVVCETTQFPELKIRHAALECLVSVSSMYYEKLATYMLCIFNITTKAVREDEEPVALQAMEFWSSICDEEIDILDECGSDFTVDSKIPCYYLIRQAYPALVPMLLGTLLKQEKDQDKDEGTWNIARTGGIRLGLVARTVGDDIVSLVMPFMEENIAKPDAIGSILEGPSPDKLIPIINVALDFMLTAMLKYPNNHVKDTTARTLGRIFEFLHGSTVATPVITHENCQQTLTVLLQSMKDVPNVVEKACCALYFLVQGYKEVGSASPLSPFFQDIIHSLLTATHKKDAGESWLRTATYEMLNEVAGGSTEETAPTVMQLVPVIMMELHKTLEAQKLSYDERERSRMKFRVFYVDACRLLFQNWGRLSQQSMFPCKNDDQMMELFLSVFACKNAMVHEGTMLAYATRANFLKDMQGFYPYLGMGLQNFDECQVCAITVGVVENLYRALAEKILPFCAGILSQLHKGLSSTQLHRSVEPLILTCFGDIALAIGKKFKKRGAYAMQCQCSISLQSYQGNPSRFNLED